MDYYDRYIMRPQLIYSFEVYMERLNKRRIPESRGSQNSDGSEIKKFSLDRYMREHVYMSSSNLDLVDVKIHFKESLMETLLTRFYLRKYTLQITPTTEFWGNERTFRATITVQENEGLYQWLMQHSDKVIVMSPEHVRKNLKQRHLEALQLLEESEN